MAIHIMIWKKTSIKGYGDLDIFIHVWDIPRFHKLNESTSNREPIEIQFKDLLDGNVPGIECLKVPHLNELYECYLSILPGTVLAKLYKEYSNELLESNVRAFLGQTGKYNKGIRDTIRAKPQMFLPYNNGITATAENVATEKDFKFVSPMASKFFLPNSLSTVLNSIAFPINFL